MRNRSQLQHVREILLRENAIMGHVLYALLYVVTLSAISLLINWGILLPWFLHRHYPIDPLSVIVYSIYFCLPCTIVAAAGFGLVFSFKPSVRGWKAHAVRLLILSLIILFIQACSFPRS
jgi:hypothetical protein